MSKKKTDDKELIIQQTYEEGRARVAKYAEIKRVANLATSKLNELRPYVEDHLKKWKDPDMSYSPSGKPKWEVEDEDAFVEWAANNIPWEVFKTLIITQTAFDSGRLIEMLINKQLGPVEFPADLLKLKQAYTLSLEK